MRIPANAAAIKMPGEKCVTSVYSLITNNL
jgi:hypothetical protein